VRHANATPLEILAADGVPLAATLFAPPDGSAPSAAVLIVPAMGVSQSYYADFAAWLAGQGYLVATFDYRGVGRSLRGHLRDARTDLVTWGRLDCAALVAELDRRAPGLPLRWLGHSLGGQLLPFVPDLSRVERVVTVASGSGYWLDHDWPLLLKVTWLWFVLVPLLLPLLGYFPGRRLRKVGDVPGGAMAQWRRWCLDPDYAVGAEGEDAQRACAGVRLPIHSLSFTDDEFMSARNTTALHDQYSAALVTRRRLAPREVGARRIGHFGAFRRRFEATLWRDFILPALR
jgi:predicted alpha/beta hydrolase